MTVIRNRARALRKNMTDAERHLWSRLRRRQINGFRFRRQFPSGPHVVDFVCLEARLIVELDGGQHAENVERDQRRDEWLHAQNFKVMRFWNDQALQETDAVLEAIMCAFNNAPPPHPSPVKGEGELAAGSLRVPPPLAGGGEGEG